MKIKVQVRPRSERQEIIETEDGCVAYLKSPAREGQANIELLKLMRKKFGHNYWIISGLKSEIKILEVQE